jgi:cyclic pyranopterin phosphate synthase
VGAISVEPETGALSHVSPSGDVTMVDVAAKAVTQRFAHARAIVRVSSATEAALRAATLAKGDAFVTAQLAGIMAAKQTANLIPLAHPLPLAHVEVRFSWSEPGALAIDATATTAAQTGVEMEAMVAASVAALTLYDMTKAVDKGTIIEMVRLIEKRGGKSGTWRAPQA